jgi:excisionase family DNA binding protein
MSMVVSLEPTEAAMATESRTNRETIEELLRRDHYTPEELAELVGMSAHQIRHAVRAGELRGFTVDHHVLAIRREDVVRWLLERGS